MGHVFSSALGKNPPGTQQASDFSNEMSQYARAPLSAGSQAYSALGNWMTNPSQLPSQLSLTGPLQDIAGQQQTANQSLLDTGARGGQLTSALANNVLQGQLARQRLQSQLQQQLFGQALGGTNLGLSGLGSAAQIQQGIGAQQLNQSNQLLGGLGKGAGALLGKGR